MRVLSVGRHHATQQSIIGRTEAGLTIEIMFGLDVTHRAGFERITSEWVLARKTAGPVQHGPGGYAGGGKHDIPTGEIEQVVFAVEIRDAATFGTASLVVIANQAALHLASYAA